MVRLLYKAYALIDVWVTAYGKFAVIYATTLHDESILH